MSAKITYLNGSYLTPSTLNSYLGTNAATGHAHDQGSDATSAPFVNLRSHVTDRVQPINMSLPGYITGLTMSSGATLSTGIGIEAGTCSCVNAAGTEWVTVTTIAQSKVFGTPWMTGFQMYGLPNTVTMTNETWYHVFLIVAADGVTYDIGFDDDVNAVNLLAASSYVYYRRIGSIFWTLFGTNHICPFFQNGDNFLLDYTVQTDTGIKLQTVSAAADTNGHSLTIDRVPQGVSVRATMAVGVETAGATAKYVRLSNGYAAAASTDMNFNVELDTSNVNKNNPAGYYQRNQVQLYTNTSGQIRYMLSDAASTPIDFVVLSYIDDRGKL